MLYVFRVFLLLVVYVYNFCILFLQFIVEENIRVFKMNYLQLFMVYYFFILFYFGGYLVLEFLDYCEFYEF